jgi:hypothetical protein
VLVLSGVGVRSAATEIDLGPPREPHGTLIFHLCRLAQLKTILPSSEAVFWRIRGSTRAFCLLDNLLCAGIAAAARLLCAGPDTRLEISWPQFGKGPKLPECALATAQ